MKLFHTLRKKNYEQINTFVYFSRLWINYTFFFYYFLFWFYKYQWNLDSPLFFVYCYYRELNAVSTPTIQLFYIFRLYLNVCFYVLISWLIFIHQFQVCCYNCMLIVSAYHVHSMWHNSLLNLISFYFNAHLYFHAQLY